MYSLYDHLPLDTLHIVYKTTVRLEVIYDHRYRLFHM